MLVVKNDFFTIHIASKKEAGIKIFHLKNSNNISEAVVYPTDIVRLLSQLFGLYPRLFPMIANLLFLLYVLTNYLTIEVVARKLLVQQR